MPNTCIGCTLSDSATKLQHAMEHDYKQPCLNTIQYGTDYIHMQFPNEIFPLEITSWGVFL